MTIKINLLTIFKNDGNIQNALNNKNLSQNLNPISSSDYELLKLENHHLKEKIKLLERLLNTYQK